MVGELRHRDRGERVSQCEREPRHQADLRICDRQIALIRFSHNRDQVPVITVQEFKQVIHNSTMRTQLWGGMRGISLVALLSMP